MDKDRRVISLVEEISIGVSDWARDTAQGGPVVRSEGEVVQAVKEHGTTAVAKSLIVGVEAKVTPGGIISANKALLLFGAQKEVAEVMERQRAYTLPNGGMVRAPAHVASGVDNGHYVDTGGADAAALAEHYLMTNVLGRVRERLEIIAASRGDARAAWDRFAREGEKIAAALDGKKVRRRKKV